MTTRYEGLARPKKPDYEALLRTLRRQGTPGRVHHMELFHDAPIFEAIVERFELMKDVDRADPDYERKKMIRFRRFLGFDYVSAGLDVGFQFKHVVADDTAAAKNPGGQRAFMEEHKGPITSWEEFEAYPWPDPDAPAAAEGLEWWNRNLPDDMCLACHTGHFAELLSWLMGYETLCYALYEQRDLVRAIFHKALAFHEAEVRRCLQYDRVKIIWGSDDMGFRTGLLISPADTREFVLSGHKRLAAMAHAAGRVYLLHSCGNLADIIDDLTDDVKIDAKHSFEDTIEDVRQAKRSYGRKIALIGGIDVDFLCKADAQAIRRRVRDTLDVCQPGGGYCLGSGNSVVNYMPVDNYLAMVDEGWRYGQA